MSGFDLLTVATRAEAVTVSIYIVSLSYSISHQYQKGQVFSGINVVKHHVVIVIHSYIEKTFLMKG